MSRPPFIDHLSKILGHGAGNDPRRHRRLLAQDLTAIQTLIAQTRRRSAAERQRLLHTLCQNVQPRNHFVIPVPTTAAATEGIAALIARTTPEWDTGKQVAAWHTPLIDAPGLETALAGMGVPLFWTDSLDGPVDQEQRRQIRRAIKNAYLGITGADYCVAETATLAQIHRPGQPRALSLVPAVHVAVVGLDQIVADLKELYALLRGVDDPPQMAQIANLTLISGPSKTADIELCMVPGAHGPKAVHIFVVTGSLEEELS